MIKEEAGDLQPSL